MKIFSTILASTVALVLAASLPAYAAAPRAKARGAVKKAARPALVRRAAARVPAKRRAAKKSQPKQRWTTVPVRYIDGNTLVRLMRFLQGSRGIVRYSRRLNLLLLKDSPEHVAQMLQLKRRLDVPQWQFQVKIHLIKAEKTRAKGLTIDKGIEPALRKTLRMFARYNHFALKDIGLLRVTNNHYGFLRMGGNSGIRVRIVPRYVAGSTGDISVQLKLSRMIGFKSAKGLRFLRRNLVTTTLMTRNGHTTIVGASHMNGTRQALIVVLTVKATRPGSPAKKK